MLKIFWIFLIFILGFALGIFTTISYNNLLKVTSEKTQLSSAKLVNDTEVKKKSLTKFYKEYISASDKRDWAIVYEAQPKTIKTYLSKENFIAYYNSRYKNDYTENIKVNKIWVEGNKGFVDRVVIVCLTKECRGKNRIEDNSVKEFIYIAGKWQLPDPKPSEKALELSSFIYVNSDEKNQQSFRDQWSMGSDNDVLAIRRFAIELDQDAENLAITKARIDKYKADRSKPIVNVQQPDIIMPQKQSSKSLDSLHCSSNSIGSYTYTNCY